VYSTFVWQTTDPSCRIGTVNLPKALGRRTALLLVGKCQKRLPELRFEWRDDLSVLWVVFPRRSDSEILILTRLFNLLLDEGAAGQSIRSETLVVTNNG